MAGSQDSVVISHKDDSEFPSENAFMVVRVSDYVPPPKTKRQILVNDIAATINCNSRENESGTPDFILAEYLVSCLEAYEAVHRSLGRFYGPA